jgi:hypothetical protein
MTRRTSLRAAARARYRDKTKKGPTRTASPSDLPLAEGGPRFRGDERGASRAVATPLTRRARALYEDSVVPVREIARLAGVSERTLYKHVQRGGWRRRYRVAARDNAVSAARGRLFVPEPVFAPVKGAGGRFVAREQADAPHAAGLGALDPAGGAAAAEACVAASALSAVAMAEATADAQAREAHARAQKLLRADLRALETLSDAIIDLARQRGERPGGGNPQADRLCARMEAVIVAQMERLVLRG